MTTTRRTRSTASTTHASSLDYSSPATSVVATLTVNAAEELQQQQPASAKNIQLHPRTRSRSSSTRTASTTDDNPTEPADKAPSSSKTAIRERENHSLGSISQNEIKSSKDIISENNNTLPTKDGSISISSGAPESNTAGDNYTSQNSNRNNVRNSTSLSINTTSNNDNSSKPETVANPLDDPLDLDKAIRAVARKAIAAVAAAIGVPTPLDTGGLLGISPVKKIEQSQCTKETPKSTLNTTATTTSTATTTTTTTTTTTATAASENTAGTNAATPIAAVTARISSNNVSTSSATTTETEDRTVAVTTSHSSVKKRKWGRPSTRAVKQEFSTSAQENEEEEEESDERDDDEMVIDKEDDDEDYGRIKRSNTATTRAPSQRQSRKQPQLSEYELQRLENIKQNQAMLLQLELPTAMSTIVESVQALKVESAPALARIPRKAPAQKASAVVLPVRTSNRVRGLAVDSTLEVDENDQVRKTDAGESHQRTTRRALNRQSPVADEPDQGDQGDGEEEDDTDASQWMSGDLFFDQETRSKAIRVDGHYRGWINAEVMAEYGFEGSAQEAWDANGGGTFSFKNPMGEGGGSSSRAKSGAKRSKHDAKELSKSMFKKNPNAYFYRHNAPGLEQLMGDWTEEEKELFLEVAREFGCGDKWGLFASHIPHRVGYQCSNFYRQVVLPQGLVFDSNYQYTSR
ncbi:hypothetical protein BGZ83_000880, partial [Gryganskiella cystojenkinii]